MGVNLITTVTLIGMGLYILRLAISLLAGVVRGEIDPRDVEAVSRGWGSVDSDVYDGEWAARNGGVWCDGATATTATTDDDHLAITARPLTRAPTLRTR